MNNSDVEHLRSAIAVAWGARQHGNHPFGAVLVDEHDRVILEAGNTVVTGKDCTGHAETNLVRLASRHFTPENLAHFILYTSTEPCCMCAGAIHWSRIGRVVYALSEVDLYDIVGPSPDQLLLTCREVFAHCEQPLEVTGPCKELEAEARAVHEGFWKPTLQAAKGEKSDLR
ncbi:MAG TPA: nucleoside deaminase [Anaerolineales bacterium]|nr:nucleoside deaminase [Anaerolineales bacterium]